MSGAVASFRWVFTSDNAFLGSKTDPARQWRQLAWMLRKIKGARGENPSRGRADAPDNIPSPATPKRQAGHQPPVRASSPWAVRAVPRIAPKVSMGRPA